MLKPIITLCSIALAAVVIGVILHLQRTPLALTNPSDAVSSPRPALLQRSISAARPAEVLPREQPASGQVVHEPIVVEPEYMFLQEVTVEAEPPRKPSQGRPARKAEPVLVPCSEWEELGPNAGVRRLCPETQN
jgi:hypothetical protein